MEFLHKSIILDKINFVSISINNNLNFHKIFIIAYSKYDKILKIFRFFLEIYFIDRYI